VRDNTKGRRHANREIDLASLEREDPDGTTLAEELADPLADPEAEALALAQEVAYRRIAERVLSDRDREIYFRIHYLGETRSSICGEYGLTAQAIGQIYAKSARKIHEASRQDPEFLRISDSDEGGTR
jgi:DNA-directed RNA polymerase sigma subunit (sigma70/sigma32)